MKRAWFTLFLLAGCGASDGAPDAAMGDEDAGATEPEAPAREVTCIDESISQLMLFDEVAADAIFEEVELDGGGFETLVDATGGGLSPTESYVYVRLTEDGMEQVDLDDEEALSSTGWHLALRRYVIRLNSGVSGPGDITAGRTSPATVFDRLDEPPASLEYRTEAYFTEACDFVSDGSGIGAPATALASFWNYSGCLEMTGNVYVVALPEGRFAKLQVLAYYADENQEICDDTGSVPTPSGAGNLRIRWALMP